MDISIIFVKASWPKLSKKITVDQVKGIVEKNIPIFVVVGGVFPVLWIRIRIDFSWLDRN
jgi:hypothetical protein